MDEHFRTAPAGGNLPMLLGLLGVWYGNFFGAQSHAVLPYSHYLSQVHRLPPAARHGVQRQVGRPGRRAGRLADRARSCGARPGTNGQHAYYQLLHQGTKLIPADFIGFARPVAELRAGLGGQHDLLMANLFAQGQALAFGKTAEEVRAEGVPEEQVPHRTFPGNRPTTTILADRATPSVLGQLDRALRAQGVRPGRDLGHQLLRPVGRRARQGAGQAGGARADRGRGGAGAGRLDGRAGRQYRELRGR